jgi:hypothetical protein
VSFDNKASVITEKIQQAPTEENTEQEITEKNLEQRKRA